MDVDDVIHDNIYRPAGFTIRYTDGSFSDDKTLRATREDPNKTGY
jgi:hypothetical protein